MRYTLDHFVYRAVAAQNQNQIGSLADGVPGERARFPRRGGRQQTGMKIDARQRGNGTLEGAFGIAPRNASGGVIDQDRLAK